jgi:two-component system chemotaxis response regulator CheY
VGPSAETNKLIKEIFLVLGFKHIYTATDPAEAVSMLREVRISIIITDHTLKISPTSDSISIDSSGLQIKGVELVRSIRLSKNSPSPYVAILMVASSNLSGEEATTMRDSGVNGLLLRPLEAEQLCKKVRDIIESPRIFITSKEYAGPCRRIHKTKWTAAKERRKKQIQVISSRAKA